MPPPPTPPVSLQPAQGSSPGITAGPHLPAAIFHNLGQYTPWFDAAADHDALRHGDGEKRLEWDTPEGCEVVFVSQVSLALMMERMRAFRTPARASAAGTKSVDEV